MTPKKTSKIIEIIKKVKKEIKPDEKKVIGKVNLFVEKLKKEVKKQKKSKDIQVFVGGSTAKKTFLKGDHDCDIFLRFNYDKYKNKNISKEAKKILKNFEYELVHGSRNYFQIKKDGITFEIVPVLKIRSWKKALNVTDMSPLHVNWVNKKLKNKPRLRDEIRTAKKFFKSNNLYGAESHIKGFSGHVLDIMIINYGSFLKMLKALAKAKKNIFVDVENFYKDEKDARKKLNKSKISPVIVIDPVMPERNAAAAISRKKLLKAKDIAQRFLEKPQTRFFKKKETDIEKIKKKKIKKNQMMIILEAIPLDKKEDVAASKMLKAFELINNHLYINGFKVYEFEWDWKKTKGYGWYIVDKEIPKTYEKVGPLLKLKKHVGRFKKNNKKIFEKGNRIYSIEKRKHTKPNKFVKKFIKEPFFDDKIKKIKLVFAK